MAAERSNPDEDSDSAARAAWRAAVDKVLRGRSFDDVLVSSSRDGLEVQPLYTAAEVDSVGSPLPVDESRIASGWDIRQRHGADDPAAGNRAVLEDLEGGVTSIELATPVEGWTSEALDTAIAGVLLDLAPVVLAPHADLDAARSLAAIIAERGDSETTGSWLGLDPIGEVARGGRADSLDAAAALAADLAPRLPEGAVFTVDGTRYADAGATAAQELAWSLATGVAYLRALEAAGLSVAQAAATIGFRTTADADQFGTIAMLRAARQLWSRVLDACGVAPSQWTHALQAVTARSMYSRRDPWVNMLRATSAALAAGVGGADAVTVLPFDTAVGGSDRFAHRNARNIQLLLVEESQLGQLVDPAGGSWFVESLTTRLAAEAWSRFQAVEAEGGVLASLQSGQIEKQIDAAWNERLGQLAIRAEPITGVSEFPMLEGDTLVREVEEPDHTGLPLRRLAAPFEALRDAADRSTAHSDARPAVHLAALGELAVHTGRSTWISNLVGVGGVVAVGGDDHGASSPIEAAARFVDSGLAVAVICSSDGVYAERAAATATALKEAGASLVVLAGAPGEGEDGLRTAGVDEFWHVGIDVLATLRRLHDVLGLG